VISLISEYHHYPSVRHLSTQQGISLGQKNRNRTPFSKKFNGAGCVYFFGKKRTAIVFLQLKAISCSTA